MIRTVTPAVLAVLLLTAFSSPRAELQPTPTASDSVATAAWAVADDGRGTAWIVDKKDNICGLDQPRQLTSPAKVDYKGLLDATPEVKLIRRKRIDPNSADGVRLMAKARSRILTACETVRQTKGRCSVWKKISLRDPKKDRRKKPLDITSEVKNEIRKNEAS